jgi:hypothetical protein
MTDEKYQRGQIYTIRNITDNTMIYVGSTINMLAKRFGQHKRKCNSGKVDCSLYNYIENNDWGNWYIELYEDYPCNNKKELERREGQVIRDIGTINMRIPGRTRKEYYHINIDNIKENKKKYYHENLDKILENAKNYYKDNKQTINERTKIYYQNNKEILLENAKKYHEDNKDVILEKKKEYYKKVILEKNKEKVCCEICGAFLTKAYLKKHQQSKKCLAVANK